MTTDKKPFIAVNATPAMSGHFATLYCWSEDEEFGGFYEPYESGFGRYATWQEAEREAAQWAEEMGIEHRPLTQEIVDEAKAYTANARKRIARVKEIRDATGCDLRTALQQVKEELGEA